MSIRFAADKISPSLTYLTSIPHYKWQFTSVCKIAKVTSIHKTRALDEAGNYWHVSVLGALSNILSTMLSHLIYFLILINFSVCPASELISLRRQPWHHWLILGCTKSMEQTLSSLYFRLKQGGRPCER